MNLLCCQFCDIRMLLVEIPFKCWVCYLRMVNRWKGNDNFGFLWCYWVAVAVILDFVLLIWIWNQWNIFTCVEVRFMIIFVIQINSFFFCVFLTSLLNYLHFLFFK